MIVPDVTLSCASVRLCKVPDGRVTCSSDILTVYTPLSVYPQSIQIDVFMKSV